MKMAEFAQLVEQAKIAKPFWFAAPAEQPATIGELADLERQLGLTLPAEYKAYLLEYGGGYFGRINVFSANPASDWYLPLKSRLIPDGSSFLAVTDDQTGGYYGFAVEGGKVGDEVSYIHPDDGWTLTPIAPSFLEYVASVGLAADKR